MGENGLYSCKKSRTREAGSILVLTALFIVTLLSLAGLAYEVTLGYTALQQADSSAKLSALAAIEAYTIKDGTHSVKLAAAVSASNLIAGDNDLPLFSSPESQVIGTSSSASHPVLTPGIFVQDGGSGTTTCSDGSPAPCFDSNLAGRAANAINISGNLYGPVPTRLLGLLGVKKLTDGRVDATATVLPRHTCFLIDLSASMSQETHVYQGFSPSSSRDASDLIDGANGISVAYKRGAPDDSYFNLMPASRSGVSATNIHFQDDFEEISPLQDADYGSFADRSLHPNPATGLQYSANQSDSSNLRITGPYRIDTYRGVGYDGPQPLTSVFDAVRSAIVNLESSTIPGDQVCLIFHDSNLSWPRIVNLNNNFQYMKDLLDTTKYLNGDGSIDQTRGLGKMLRHGLFPAKGSNTSISLAISEAESQFVRFQNANPGISVSRSIVIIGDGMANCDGSGICDNSYFRHKNAVADLNEYAIGMAQSNRTPIHVLLAGDHIGPHTLAIEDADGSCITDSEARSRGLEYVVGNASDDEAEAAFSDRSLPYYQINYDMYNVAKMTGGVWAPIRPHDASIPCDSDGNSTSCSAGGRALSSCLTKDQQIEKVIDKILEITPYVIQDEFSG